jgi:hypothetical protein
MKLFLRLSSLLVAAAVALTPAVALAQEDSEGGGAAETGPPWTYQMAKVTLVLLVLLGLAIGAIYYRLVVRRRRGDV